MLKLTLLTSAFYLVGASGDSPNGGDIVTLLSHASGPTLLAVIIVGALKEWWVTGRQYKRIVAERDQLLHLALRQVETAEKLVGKD